MEPVASKKRKPRPRPRREFTPEFKAEIVRLCQAGDRTIAQIAAEFDLVNSAVRRWIAQADAAANPGPTDVSSAEMAELMALRRENQQLKQDVAILKRAMAFFATETR